MDYACTVLVIDCVVDAQEGMFSPFEIGLTHEADGSLIEIVVAPAPKVTAPPDADETLESGRAQTRQSCKPAVSYGWDFHPRLISLGIWEDTYLETRPAATWLNYVEVAYDLADDYSSADLRLIAGGSATRLRWTLRDPAGALAATQEGAPETLVIHVDQPELWWPITEVAPALYTSTVETHDADGQTAQTISQRVGLRRIRLVMAPGQYELEGDLPSSQQPVPITFKVNGREIFIRGPNWAPPEIFPGTLTAERYGEQLALFAEANSNLLRAWGGASVNKKTFFKQCDELGLLVWQEVQLACNRCDDIPAYLRVLDQESRYNLRRRRLHACIAQWCACNELFNS